MIIRTLIALAAIGVMITAIAAYRDSCASGICGNECMSSVDCLDGCVCMKADPYGNGICVSFD
jgi:hypothetical protein